jgi:flagellar hook-associated protein 3 FlgL
MTIDRISTAAMNSLMLAQLNKSQSDLNTADTQVASGKVATDYSGYGYKTAAMEATRSKVAQLNANVTTATTAQTQLDLQDSQLSQLSDLANNVQTAISGALANGDGSSLMSSLQGYYDQAVQILNTKSGDTYIYGGNNGTTPPVTATNLSDLAALPSVSGAFDDGTAPRSISIGNGQTAQVGVMASKVASNLFSVFQSLAQSDQSSSFGTTLTDTQQGVLSGALTSASSAADDVNSQAALNGANYGTVTNAIAQLNASSTVYSNFLSNIENVDMAGAISKVNQDQVALQAAMQVTASLGQLSLLNYLTPSAPA